MDVPEFRDTILADEADGLLRRAADALGAQVARLPRDPSGLKAIARSAPPEVSRRCLATIEQAEAKLWELAMLARRTAAKRAHVGRGTSEEADLYQEGLLGLYEAALRYDQSRGLRFQTFARWRVHYAVAEHQATMHPGTRVPRAALQCERDIRRAEGAGLRSDEEIAREVRAPIATVQAVRGLGSLRSMVQVHDELHAIEVEERDDRRERQIAALAVAVAELPDRQRRTWQGRMARAGISAAEGPARMDDVAQARAALQAMQPRAAAGRPRRIWVMVPTGQLVMWADRFPEALEATDREWSPPQRASSRRWWRTLRLKQAAEVSCG